MKETEVVLVAPNTSGSYTFVGKQRENLALGCLGSYLSQQGLSNELIDARFDNLTPDQVADQIIQLRPLLVGLTLMEQEPAIWSSSLVAHIKEELPETHIVAGSYFPTLDPQKCIATIPEIDSIVQGEGEETLLELTLKIVNKEDWRSILGIAFNNNGTLVKNRRRKLIPDLDDLPEPTRYADSQRLSKISLEGSRGCFSSCTFCSINPHLNLERSTWRGKTPQSIIKELVNLRSIYPNISHFRFVDADFIGLGKYYERLQLISEGLIESGFSSLNSKLFIETQSRNVLGVPPQVWESLQRAGLYQVFIGVETGSEKIKKCLRKSSSTEDDLKAIDFLKSFGINVTYGFIMLSPWSDMTDVLTNISILRLLGNAGLDKYFSELILTPGTRAFETVGRKNGMYVEKVEGVDHYLYSLQPPLNNIRKIGTYMLEHPEYRSFLIDISSLYAQINDLLINGKNDRLLGLQKELDQTNLDIFLTIIEIVQQYDHAIDEEQIKKLLSDTLNTYKPKILLLKNTLSQ